MHGCRKFTGVWGLRDNFVCLLEVDRGGCRKYKFTIGVKALLTPVPLQIRTYGMSHILSKLLEPFTSVVLSVLLKKKITIFHSKDIVWDSAASSLFYHSP